VEKAHGLASVSERSHPDLQRAFLSNPASLNAGRVLIYCDHVPISQEGQWLRSQFRKVSAYDQGRRQKRPETHLCAVLLGLHAASSQSSWPWHDVEHFGIIPMARPGKALQTILPESDTGHRLPVIPQVLGGAPQIAAHRCGPRPTAIHAVLA